MGKGGANPYPLWWASSDEDVVRDKPSSKSPKKERKKYNTDDIYKDQKEKEREYWDEYYKEKSWSQRRKEFEKQFKEDFMKGKYFSFHEDQEPSYFHEPSNDIDPVFKIKKSSSFEDYKKEYRKLILENHPDKGGKNELFIKIQEAWERVKLYFDS